MTFPKIACAVILSLSAMSCTAPSPSFKAAPGQSVDEVARGLTQTRAISVFIAGACGSQGVTLIEPNVRRALTRDLANLKAQGYDTKALQAAFAKAGKDKRLVASAIRYLEVRGAKRGNLASVCAVGKAEIAAKTAVGRLLKTG